MGARHLRRRLQPWLLFMTKSSRCGIRASPITANGRRLDITADQGRLDSGSSRRNAGAAARAALTRDSNRGSVVRGNGGDRIAPVAAENS